MPFKNTLSLIVPLKKESNQPRKKTRQKCLFKQHAVTRDSRWNSSFICIYFFRPFLGLLVIPVELK